MLGRFMNNYYYGKSGKGDYTPDDLPKNRWQLFLEMLRTRMSALCRLNLVYVLPWLPTLIVLGMFYTNTTSMLNYPYQVDALLQQINAGQQLEDGSVQVTLQDGSTEVYSAQDIASLRELDAIPDEELAAESAQYIQSQTLLTLLLLVPCIFITGPWTAGVAYVTRNWARDEHAFVWSDCKDAMKENWKGALVLSGITSVVPLLVYLCWTFYGEMPAESPVMMVLLQLGQMIPLMVGMIWYMAVTYAYPMLVTYRMNMKTILRNSLILAVGRLPLSVGVRLLLVLPAALGVFGMLFISSTWAPLILLAYYILFGFTFSRFITASYTNAQFDKFINNRIEGAQVNRGLAEEDDDDWEDDEDEGEKEIKPWENGYANRGE
ncbi:MAG: YesL family protein [Clostridia bacterium]|nr:YesL family protein [Clostridia bacterium]